MTSLSFLRAPALSLAAAAAEAGAWLDEATDGSRLIRAVAPLDRAEHDDVTGFFDGLALEDLLETRAGACLVASRNVGHVPRATFALVTEDPRGALRRLAAVLHADSLRPGSLVGNTGIDVSARIAPTAELEGGIVVDPGAVIGPAAEIGRGTFLGAGCVIGAGVRIGRDCAINAAVTLSHALVGDRVLIDAGARVGQADRVASWHSGDPSLGRVVIQNDVEIGANAVVARGMFGDTVLGEGARIAALAVVGAGAVIARGAHIARSAEAH